VGGEEGGRQNFGHSKVEVVTHLSLRLVYTCMQETEKDHPKLPYSWFSPVPPHK
jgi:hypothetical protein